MTTERAYVFDGTQVDSELKRLRMLEAVFDPGTRELVLAAGLDRGMRCLEIGAGAGSIAAWMAEVVGPTGQVAAVDLSTRFLQTTSVANLAIHEADICTAELQPASFDIAHARFVFIHVPDWQIALTNVLRLLKPNGRLIVEEPDFSVSRAVAGDPVRRRAFGRVHEATRAMFTTRHMDYAFGLTLPDIFTVRDLDMLTLENDAPIVRGGTPLASMMGLSAHQLREKYVATGLATAEDIECYRAFAADEKCWAIYHGTVRALGTKRVSDGAV